MVSLQHQKLSLPLTAVTLCVDVPNFLFENFAFFQTLWCTFACMQSKERMGTLTFVTWIARSRSDKEDCQSLSSWFIIVVKGLTVDLVHLDVQTLHCWTLHSKHTVHANEWLSSSYSWGLFIQINQAFYTMSCSEDSTTGSLDIVNGGEGWCGSLDIGQIEFTFF